MVQEGTGGPELSEHQRRAKGTRWRHLTSERRAEIQEAAAEGRRRQGTDTHIAAIVARAGRLTPEQIERLRSLLPDPGVET